MIKFFRHIRRSLINQNQMGKYFKYAIGEILLVVIGILIALAVNDQYNASKENKMLQQYYVKILSEAEASIAYLQAQKNNRLNFNKQGIKALNILRSKNKDSLSALLESLGVLKEMRSLAPSFPIIDEFLSQGYLSKITNDSVKR